MKMAIASELVIEHIAMCDIAKLLGLTRRGLEYMLARIRERNANMLPLTWNRDRLVETVNALEDAGYRSLSLAESDPDPKNKAAFLANANHAYKLGVSKEILDMPKARQGQEEAPDPKDWTDGFIRTRSYRSWRLKMP